MRAADPVENSGSADVVRIQRPAHPHHSQPVYAGRTDDRATTTLSLDVDLRGWPAQCTQWLIVFGLLGLLIGGQKTPHDWHGMIFDFETLREGLEQANFVDIRLYDWRGTEIGKLDIDDFSQAYLPHMDKESGRLMMLNVEATRPRG